MGFLYMPDYLALPRNPESWVVEDILPTSGLLNVYGKAKTHKSFLALQIAEAVADPTINEVVGFPVRQHGKVCYLQVDTPRGIWSDRILQCFPNISKIVAMADSAVEGLPYPFNILGEGFNWLKNSVAEIEPLVVVIDVLREIHQGDENDSGHMQLVINTLQAAVRPAACIILSHARKNQAEGSYGLMDENRGSGYVAGRADAVLSLTMEKMAYQSRVAGLNSFDIIRTPFVTLKDPISAMALRLSLTSLSMSEKMTLLRMRFPKLSEDAARGRLRRKEESAA